MKREKKNEQKKQKRIVGPRYLSIALVVVLALVVVKNAWLSDDAYITFRSVDNFVGGDGLVYNVGERVQSYTHPLWMLLLSLIRLVTGGFYYGTIFLSILLAIGTGYLFAKLAPPAAVALGLAILIGSKAFIDYSTSGLENPLSHFFVVLFLYRFLKSDGDARSLWSLMLIAALAAMTRLDTVLLYLPPLLLMSYRAGWGSAVRAAAIGFSPLILWTLFSLIYYGAPVANPAYAKLATGIPLWDLARQSSFYYLNSLRLDPLTLVAIGCGCALAVVGRKHKELTIATGIALYLVYIIRVGGDFMSGRFFALPATAAAVLIARAAIDSGPRRLAIGAAAIVAFSLVSAKNHLFSGPGYGDVPLVNVQHFGPLPLSLIDDHGVSDERAFFYPATGLLRRNHTGRPTHQWVDQGFEFARSGSKVHEAYTLGFTGFYAGRNVHIIDPNGLTDFLIARLPIPKTRWRIGHFTRRIPQGYTESVAAGKNLIGDPNLAAYYDAARLIIRAPLFSSGRLVAIWRSNTGGYNKLIDRYVRATGR